MLSRSTEPLIKCSNSNDDTISLWYEESSIALLSAYVTAMFKVGLCPPMKFFNHVIRYVSCRLNTSTLIRVPCTTVCCCVALGNLTPAAQTGHC